jgi:putative hydrolase of the HAD superfamily
VIAPARPEALLLDAGNTIVFLDEAAVAAAARTVGADVAPERVHASIRPAVRAYERFLDGGGSHEEAWFVYMRELLVQAGAARELGDVASAAVRRSHDELNLWRRVPAGLPEILDRLRRAGVRLGVVSNSEGKIAELLETVGIASYFETVVDSGVVGVRKPDPRIFAIALDRLGVAASNALYAGDVPDIDVRGARAAGVDAVLIDAFGHYPDFDAAYRAESVAALASLWLDDARDR